LEINIKCEGKISKKHKEMRTVGKNQEMEEIKEDYMHMLEVH
jgi:hypothetical protein